MYITVRTAAEKLGISTAAIHKAIHQGRLPEIRIDGKLFLESTDVARYKMSPRFKTRGRKPARSS